MLQLRPPVRFPHLAEFTDHRAEIVGDFWGCRIIRVRVQPALRIAAPVVHIISQQITALRRLDHRHGRNAPVRKLKPVLVELDHAPAHFTAGIRVILRVIRGLKIIAYRNGIVMLVAENILRRCRMLLLCTHRICLIINPRPVGVAAP
ncbi:hypothetical protein D3C73_989860 [compost metagenome]